MKNETLNPLLASHGRAPQLTSNEITKLARLFHVSGQVVSEVYHEQYQRLAEGARIQRYVDLLAFKNTRLALRAGTGHLEGLGSVANATGGAHS
jgi:hypothetical protein